MKIAKTICSSSNDQQWKEWMLVLSTYILKLTFCIGGLNVKIVQQSNKLKNQ